MNFALANAFTTQPIYGGSFGYPSWGSGISPHLDNRFGTGSTSSGLGSGSATQANSFGSMVVGSSPLVANDGLNTLLNPTARNMALNTSAYARMVQNNLALDTLSIGFMSAANMGLVNFPTQPQQDITGNPTLVNELKQFLQAMGRDAMGNRLPSSSTTSAPPAAASTTPPAANTPTTTGAPPATVATPPQTDVAAQQQSPPAPAPAQDNPPPKRIKRLQKRLKRLQNQNKALRKENRELKSEVRQLKTKND